MLLLSFVDLIFLFNFLFLIHSFLPVRLRKLSCCNFLSHLHFNELSFISDMWWNKITYLLTYLTCTQLNWHKGAKKMPASTRPSPTKIRVVHSKDWHNISPINGKCCKVQVILLENARVYNSPLIRSALTWSGKSLVLSCVIDKTLFGKSGFRLEK